MSKRPYSREFTPRTEHSKQLTVSRVPPTLFEAFRAKVKREGLAQRPLLLRWIRNWVAGRRPDDDGPATSD
jgi:hypothetical protein